MALYPAPAPHPRGGLYFDDFASGTCSATG